MNTSSQQETLTSPHAMRANSAQNMPSHGSTQRAGTTNTEPTKDKTVNVTSKKQAIWIKSKMREQGRAKSSKLAWRQRVLSPGANKDKYSPEDLLSDLPQENQLSPLEISRRFPQGSTVHFARIPDPDHYEGADPDERIVAAFSKPASVDCILAHLIRLSAILHVKGAGRDDDGTQAIFLLSDFAGRLHAEKVLEVDLFLACEHFIETEDDGFFPTYAKLLKQVGKVGK